MGITIHQRVLEQAERTPRAVALRGPGGAYTYAELAQRVRALAHGLAAALPPGARVAIHRPKSIDAIVDLLACLCAGCAYVPLDAASPMPRTRFVLEDSGADALVTDEHTAALWSQAPDALERLALVVMPDGHGPAHPRRRTHAALAEPAPATEAVRPVAAEALAFLLYTSGSTGTPKGVAITHGNASAFVEWALEAFDVGPGDTVAVHAPLHFDLPVFDLYVSLGRGATVCPADEATLKFPEAFLRWLRSERVSVLYAVPSALLALLKRSTVAKGGLGDLRLLLYAGEEFPVPRLRELRALLRPDARVFNLYGPVETNVVTCCEVGPAELALARVPIGTAVSQARLVLVDEARAVIAPERTGVEGELLVSGPSVSPGYWRRDDLTAAAREVVNVAGESLRCHRTGDFAAWGPGGRLDFRGRRDGMVKSRGYRIDLGEIESVLADAPGVAELAAVGVPHPERTTEVVAFVVARDGSARDEVPLLARCRERLPPYMVPAHVYWRDALPHTTTGKVDRVQLVAWAQEGARR
ncbi:MAG: amino acid adenylation domain-containing protein [Myxococcaceae bacterium]|nr:amino acid adenylation domain-containing protein [Myxococcaceae bacterium]